MNYEEIAENIMEHINNEISELSDMDYVDVLEEVASSCKIQLTAKKEEMEDFY